VEPADVLTFPHGLIGLEDCRDWVLLADTQCDALAWMQSVSRPDLALPVVSPRRFVPGYRARVLGSDLDAIQIDNLDEVRILTVVNQRQGQWTVNLKGPVLINVEKRLGRQVVAGGDPPLEFAIGLTPAPLRRSA
jgi:flagellar assembly factor FliW